SNFPQAGLININGTLYGTATFGGGANEGTVFSIDPTTQTKTIVYAFCAPHYCGGDGAVPESTLLYANGLLYGTTVSGGVNGGILFSVDPSSGAETILYKFAGTSGDVPGNAMILIKDKLYGMTSGGGAYNQGTIFSYDTSARKERVLYSFQ